MPFFLERAGKVNLHHLQDLAGRSQKQNKTTKRKGLLNLTIKVHNTQKYSKRGGV